MAYVVIEDFNGGLDSRRLSVAGTPGTLMELVNAHITRGGEIEKRKAFVSTHALPTGTKGLARVKSDLYVFGSEAEPAGLPSGVKYQRLQAPGDPTLEEVLSWDTFANRLYVAARFSDDTVHHFYDGDRVVNWFDGVSRGSFTVAGTTTEAGSPSTVDIPEFEKTTEEMDVSVDLVDPEGSNKVTIADTFTVASGDSSTVYRDKTRDAINTKTSSTNVSAVDISGPGLQITYDDAKENKKDWRVSFNVKGAGLTADIDSEAQNTNSCSGSTTCTVSWDLECTADGGTSPYTFAWSITDDGGALSASLSSTSGSTTQLDVTSAVSGTCTEITVRVKCEVTDNASTTISVFEDVTSFHCDSSGGE